MKCSYSCNGELELLREEKDRRYYRCRVCGHRISTGFNFWATHGRLPFHFENDFDFGLDDDIDLGF